MPTEALIIDESLGEDIITVAGFIVDGELLDGISTGWRRLKRVTFGIDEHMELKYTLSEGHPTRGALDAKGWPHSRRVPEMLKHIASRPEITILANTLIDIRGKVSPADFYLDALMWCIRRFGNALPPNTRQGPNLVIVDMPPAPEDFSEREVGERLTDLYRNVGTAPFEQYQKRWRSPETYSSGATAPTLRSLGFAPMLLASHAKHSDLLQIADVIAGCVRDFCNYTLKNTDGWGNLPAPTYRDDNFALIGPQIRRHEKRVHRMGFDLFPQYYLGYRGIIQRVEDLCAGQE